MKATIYTDGSYKPLNGAAGWGFYLEYEDDRSVQAFGAADATNSAKSELVAFHKGVEFATDKKNGITDVTLISDCQYVTKTYGHLGKYSTNGWKTTTGKEVANIETWKAIKSDVDEYTGDITVQWVKGHNGTKGNEISDRLANRGAICWTNKDTGSHYEYSETTPDTLKDALDTKATNKELNAVEPLTPLLTGKSLFFKTNVDVVKVNDDYVYVSTSYPKFTPDKDIYTNKVIFNLMQHKNAGARSGENHFGILFTKTPIKILDEMKQKFGELDLNAQMSTVLVLNNIRKKKVWYELATDADRFYSINSLCAIDKNGQLLGAMLDPPRLAPQIENYANVGILLKQWLDEGNMDKIETFDITDKLVSKVKTKFTINKELDTEDRVLRETVVDRNGREIEIPLTTSVDTPNWAQLSSIIKNTKETIKIEILLWDNDDYGHRVGLLIDCDGDQAIYYTNDANHRLKLDKSSSLMQ